MFPAVIKVARPAAGNFYIAANAELTAITREALRSTHQKMTCGRSASSAAGPGSFCSMRHDVQPADDRQPSRSGNSR